MFIILYTLICTHITIIAVTLFLHRSQAHRSVEFNPILQHFFRFWLWLTTGMVTKQWVAIHRKHHRFSDVQGDPHSPHVFGINRVFFGGVFLYKQAARDRAVMDQYGAGTPDDWIEKNIYSAHSAGGLLLLLILNLSLFGLWGWLVWVVQIIWIPLWAAGVVNGVGHWVGYRNGTTKDHSRNISPWGIIIGGEELHNNHHLAPASAKLSRQWFEFDIGWFYIKLLERVGLAKVRNLNTV
jgi:stearoyl-CoA desaturase (delta-9 desaturase)